MDDGILLPDDGGWVEWRRLILSEIKRLNEGQERSARTIVILQNDVTKLNLLAAIFGAIGGILATLTVQIVMG